MDFTRLNNEYTVYWKTHKLSTALTNLRDIDFYLSQGNMDTFLDSYTLLLQPYYLSGLYSQLTGVALQDVVTNISYTDLLKNFKLYLTSLIQESKAIDDASKRYLDELNNNIFSELARTGQSFVEATANLSGYLPVILLAGGFLLLFVLIKK